MSGDPVRPVCHHGGRVELRFSEVELVSDVVTVPVLAARRSQTRVELRQPPSSRVEQSDVVRLPAAGLDLCYCLEGGAST